MIQKTIKYIRCRHCVHGIETKVWGVGFMWNFYLSFLIWDYFLIPRPANTCLVMKSKSRKKVRRAIRDGKQKTISENFVVKKDIRKEWIRE